MPVRYPRCHLQIDGARIPCINASVTRSAQRRTDTFTALLSITKAAQYGYDLARWADFQPTEMSILMSTAPGGADERVMITGMCDEPNIALASMRVSVSGRDKSASLIEQKRNEKFANQKPKDIAGKIAEDHGLQLQFQDGGDFSGHTYTQDTANLILNRTDFEVLSNLADQIGYRWFVDGSTLYMEPKSQENDGFDLVWVPPTPGQPGYANVKDLSLKRNMSAARPHKVLVKSWHHRSKQLFKHEAGVDGVGNPLAYQDHHNGKTQSQVQDLAKSRLRDRIRHELSITYRGPGDLDADVRKVCNLSGTGTIFDQPYATDRITWDMEYGSDFGMVVDASAAKLGRNPEGG